MCRAAVLAVVLVLAACEHGGNATADAPKQGVDAPARGIDAPPGATTVFDFTSFATCPTPELSLLGTAMCAGGNLQLTAATTSQVGTVWWRAPVPVTPSLQLEMKATLHFAPAGSNTAGDGLAFVLQSDSAGTSTYNGSAAGGGGLGYLDITPSIALELDEYKNTAYNDPNANHLGFDMDGSLVSVATGDPTFTMSTTPAFTVWLDYDGTSGQLYAYASSTTTKPSTPIVSTSDTLTRLGSSMWVGITSTCGAAKELHAVETWSLVTQ